MIVKFHKLDTGYNLFLLSPKCKIKRNTLSYSNGQFYIEIEEWENPPLDTEFEEVVVHLVESDEDTPNNWVLIGRVDVKLGTQTLYIMEAWKEIC